jgi:hypothetical protein
MEYSYCREHLVPRTLIKSEKRASLSNENAYDYSFKSVTQNRFKKASSLSSTATIRNFLILVTSQNEVPVLVLEYSSTVLGVQSTTALYSTVLEYYRLMTGSFLQNVVPSSKSTNMY